MTFSYPVPYVKIREISANNSATVDITNMQTSTYRFYRIIGNGIRPVNNNVDLYCRVSNNNGASFFAGATAYVVAEDLNTSAGIGPATAAGSGSAFTIMSNVSAAAGNHNMTFWMDLDLKSNQFFACRFVSFGVVSPGFIGVIRQSYGIGGYAVDTINALRFIFSAGNISIGNFTLYGYPAIV